MATVERRSARRGRGAASRDALTVACGLWLMAGLFLDGYVHNTRGGELESFFTPWHATLYSGFLASALVILLPALSRRGTVAERVAALSPAYRLGALGVIVFAAGGLGDSVWHTLLGIEVDLEALVSPPHLLLFAGALLILTTPLRSAWQRPGDAPALGEFMPALLATTLSTLLVAFFFMYASGLYDFHATTHFADLAAERFADDPFLPEVLTGFGIVARMLTTVLLMVPALLLVRRWRVPRGTFTILFTTFAAFMLVLDDFRMPAMVLAGLGTGIATDLLAAGLSPSADRRGALRVFATATPTVLWLSHFGVLAVTDSLGWPPIIWVGVVMFAAMAGYGLSLLAAPPAAEIEV